MVLLFFWIIVGVLALSFFGVSLESIVNSPAGQANFTYLWHLAILGYHAALTYIQAHWPPTPKP